MARPTLAAHRKFAKLVRLLRAMQAPRIYARGVLEVLWEAGYASGDPLVGDAETVEFMVDWPGAPGALAGHLVDAGFLDEGEAGRLYIHDLADHAPDYVAKRMAKEYARQEKGQTISSIRSEAAKLRWSKRNASGDHVDANGSQLYANDGGLNANGVTPAPAPAPVFSPPAPARDPSPAEPVPLAPSPEAVFASIRARGGPLTGHALARVFGQVREAEVPGALSWDVPKNAEKADGQAATIECDAKALDDVVPTMRKVFALARAGAMSKPGEVLKDPSFAFGVWCSRFTALREEIRGLSPSAPLVANGRAPPRDTRFGHARAEDQKHARTGEVKL